MKFSSLYLDPVFDNPAEYKKFVRQVARRVKRLQAHYGFDAIAFTGASGSAMAYPISMLTGIPLLYIRKTDENSHGIPIEGSRHVDVTKFAIIDDLVASGSTVTRIAEKLKERDDTLECTCIMLYNSNTSGTYNPLGLPLYHVDKKITLPKKAA